MANKSFIGTTGTTWNNAASWSLGTLPVDGDTLFSNNKTVNIDATFNQPNSSFSNNSGTSDAGAGITAGGNFNITASINVTALAVTSFAVPCLTITTVAVTSTITIATITGGSSAINTYGMSVTFAGCILTFANCLFVGGSVTAGNGLSLAAVGTVTFTSCTARGGPTAGTADGVSISANITITGTLAPSEGATSLGRAINLTNAVSNTITLSGAVVHQNASCTIRVDGGTLNFTATSETITGTPTTASAGLLQATGSGVLNWTRPAGSVQMHSGAAGPHYAYKSGAAAVITIVGDITCGTGAATYVAHDITGGSGSITITGTVTGPVATPNASGLIASSGGTVIVKHLARNASGGQMPSQQGNIRMMAGSTVVASTAAGTVTLVDASAAADYPSAADVRKNTTYASGALVGSAYIPGAASTAAGVLVDATVGTAVLRAEDIPSTLVKTTIATLASQTSFTLTTASADDNAYPIGATVVITDSVTSTQKAVGAVSAYTGATKTLTLAADPGIFTMAVGDSVAILAGAAADWTSTERSQIRHRLGIDGTANAPSASASLAEPGDEMAITTAAANVVRDAVLNRLLAGNHETAGTTGKLLQNLDVLLSTRSTPAQVTAALDAISVTALARFVTVDTLQVTAAAGSVAKLSQGAGGGGSSSSHPLASNH